MALIGTIRNKLGPIIAIVIGLALAVFILETALNSNSNLLQGSRDVVGSIDGEKIRYQDFANRVEEGVQNYKLQSNQSNIDDNIIFSLRDQTWNQLITEQVNGEEYRKLGLKVTPEELKDMFFGERPGSGNQTGIYQSTNRHF
jgi:peptidyl-prolyl cis-trans isomerase D